MVSERDGEERRRVGESRRVPQRGRTRAGEKERERGRERAGEEGGRERERNFFSLKRKKSERFTESERANQAGAASGSSRSLHHALSRQPNCWRSGPLRYGELLAQGGRHPQTEIRAQKLRGRPSSSSSSSVSER